MIRLVINAFLFAALATAFLVVGQPHQLSAKPTSKVVDVRLGAHSEATRFVIELTQSVDFTVFLLPDPYRVVIDLPEVAWDLEPGQELLGRGQISGYRYGLFRPGNSRIVLDMEGPVQVERAHVLQPEGDKGYRLVVDLAPTDLETFAKIAGWPERQTSGVAEPTQKPQIGSLQRPARKKKVIVIDPGHGGIDSGAIGKKGTYEKAVVLATAKKLKETLENTGRYEAILTRDRDIFLELRQRVDVARRAQADLFISLHADSLSNRSSLRGASVYTLSETASDKEAAALARKENRADLIAGVDLRNETDDVTSILIDLAQRETMNHSVTFARTLTPQLGRVTRLIKNTHRFAGFRVLKAPDVPSVLVELGYLSNSHDEQNLGSRKWREQLSRAITDAIDTFFENLPAEKRAARAG